MAIAFDNFGSNATATDTVSGTITVNSNTNGIILACFSVLQAGGTISATPKFNGTNMTFIVKNVAVNNATNNYYYYLNPPTGAGTVKGTSIGGDQPVYVTIASYTGVNQTTPIKGSYLGTINGGTAGTLTDTSFTAGNLFVGNAVFASPPGTLTQGAARGTVTVSSHESYMADNTAGSLVWTCSGDLTPMLGVELNVAPTAVQSSGTAVLGLGSTSTVWANNTTTGNLIVVGVNLTNAATLGTVSSITDSQSNTYTRAIRGTINTVGDVLNAELWYAKNITGGAGSVTVNHTVDNCAMFAREYSGYNTLDVTNAANGSSTTPNTGTVTTTVANELLVVATGDDKTSGQTWAAAGAYGGMVGTQTTITGLSMEDQVVASTGAQTGTLTLGGAANWEALFASFYQASSGAVTYKTLLGAGQA